MSAERGASYRTGRGSASWSDQGDSAANTALTRTIAAATGKRHVVNSFSFVVKGAATTNAVTLALKQSGTTIWEETIATAAPIGTRVSHAFPDGLEFALPGVAITGEASAGGASCVIHLNWEGFTA